MRPVTTLALAGTTHEALKRHLFPGEGLEAAALLLSRALHGSLHSMARSRHHPDPLR